MLFEPNFVLHVAEPAPENISCYEQELPAVTHYLEPLQHSLTTTATSSVFLAHYSLAGGKPFCGPVEKLTFAQLGSSEIPDLSEFAQTCKTVEFTGYIYSGSIIIHIVRQLPKVSKVDVFVGPTTQHTWAHRQELKGVTATPLCPWVTTLNIAMDLEHFKDADHGCNGEESECLIPRKCPVIIHNHLVPFTDSILHCAMNSFPSLKSFEAYVPESLRGSVDTVRSVCPGLWERRRQRLQSSLGQTAVIAKLSTLDYNKSLYHIPSWSIPNINPKSRTVSRPQLPWDVLDNREHRESTIPDFHPCLPDIFPVPMPKLEEE